MSNHTMRHECGVGGERCFNRTHRLKFGAFQSGFSGWADIDAVAERNGYLLFQEWKAPGKEVEIAQRILFRSLTQASPKIKVICVEGYAVDMTVQCFYEVYNGKEGPVVYGGINDLNAAIDHWYRVGANNQIDRDRIFAERAARPSSAWGWN